MWSRDYRDVLGGALVSATGLFAAAYGASRYDLGSFAHMGPGMFPVALGSIMAVLGLSIVVPALFRQGEPVPLNARSVIFITAAIALFAILANVVGLIPAVIVTTVTASFAEGRRNLVQTALLAIVLVALAVLVFHVGLGLSIPLAMWRL